MANVTPLKLAVVASGRTQRDIAAAVGIDEFRMSRLVNGREHATDDLRDRLARTLGRKVSDLVDPQETQDAA